MFILRMSLLLLTLTAACSSNRVSVETQTLQSANQSAQIPAQPKQQSAAVATKKSIRTETITPQPIRITLDDLPQPFATSSASKSPRVVSIPENPSLYQFSKATRDLV